ncbi:hypothetical protein ARMSODRAFT_454514 [Armillaria solidipes]|uniref:Uncharacterized protein n=1 Tax=Armillaria solidipes TaxID=1076256 RepID=A0A2H3B1Y5_9AGAR|nr:hypothetical protein ARMSODRAFT_454514 [Armillaria solidipes]
MTTSHVPFIASYLICASPAVVCLIVDFVEQDGFGLVTGISSLFGIVDRSIFFLSVSRRRDEQRTGIVDTPMLPGSMVEEADLLTSAFTMSILMAVVNTPLNGLVSMEATWFLRD